MVVATCTANVTFAASCSIEHEHVRVSVFGVRDPRRCWTLLLIRRASRVPYSFLLNNLVSRVDVCGYAEFFSFFISLHAFFFWRKYNGSGAQGVVPIWDVSLVVAIITRNNSLSSRYVFPPGYLCDLFLYRWKNVSSNAWSSTHLRVQSCRRIIVIRIVPPWIGKNFLVSRKALTRVLR